MITTTGSGPQNFPVSPGMNSSGMKAMMLETMAKVTGIAISLAPAMAASTWSWLLSWWA